MSNVLVMFQADTEHTEQMALELLDPRPGQCAIDCTFGAGGHTRAILEVPGTQVIGIDRDQSAIVGGYALVEAAQGRLTLVQDRFSNLEHVAQDRISVGVGHDLLRTRVGGEKPCGVFGKRDRKLETLVLRNNSLVAQIAEDQV